MTITGHEWTRAERSVITPQSLSLQSQAVGEAQADVITRELQCELHKLFG